LSRDSCLEDSITGSVCTLLAILSDDIHPNPGPSFSALTCATLNTQSLFKAECCVGIPDQLQSHDIQILALSETWQNQRTTPAELHDITPSGFQFFGQPWQPSSPAQSHTHTGGIGFLCRDHLKPQLCTLPSYPTFESTSITIRDNFPSARPSSPPFHPPSPSRFRPYPIPH
jgi:hypothetical protein